MADKENYQSVESFKQPNKQKAVMAIPIQSDVHLFPSVPTGSTITSFKSKSVPLPRKPPKSDDDFSKFKHERNILGNIDSNIQYMNSASIDKSYNHASKQEDFDHPLSKSSILIKSNVKTESDNPLLQSPILVFDHHSHDSHKENPDLQHKDNQENASQADSSLGLIAEKYHLGHILNSNGSIDSIDLLFKNIESKGLLTIPMIPDFASHITLTSLNLSPSFSIQSNADVNFLTTSNLKDSPPSFLTKPFFHNKDLFSNLKMLDLTSVQIDDDSLRYLIRLDSLEALGLSSTNITTLGIKYLSKHASFKSVLKCIKLCYLKNIQDDCIPHLLAFEKLQDLDMLGSDDVTLKGLFGLVQIKRDEENDNTIVSTSLKLPLQLLRIPQAAYSMLLSLHSSYQMLRSQTLLPTFQLVDQPYQTKSMSQQELVDQLRIHRNYYPNIYLNLPREELMERLQSILISRMKEERLWSLL